MSKRKNLSMQEIDKMPENYIRAIEDIAVELSFALKLHLNGVPQDVALSALNWTYCCILHHFSNDDMEELKKIAELSCIIIQKNVEALIEQMAKIDKFPEFDPAGVEELDKKSN